MYEASEIPAGAFGGSPDRPEDEVKTISFSHHIVARKDLSDTTVAAFTRQLFAIRQTVMNEFPLAAKIETPDTDKDAFIPVHPGAAAFVDGEEKTFLDRYSDFIWWGLMGLSAMGSIGAWFAGYLKKDERSNNSTLRERLLEMIATARSSDSTEELDQMQAEADNILRDTLQCFEHGADRGRRADLVQHRTFAIPSRGGRPKGASDDGLAEFAASGRGLAGDWNLSRDPSRQGVLQQPASGNGTLRRQVGLHALKRGDHHANETRYPGGGATGHDVGCSGLRAIRVRSGLPGPGHLRPRLPNPGLSWRVQSRAGD